MKKHLLLGLIFFAVGQVKSAEPVHPSIYGTNATKMALREKVATVPWAGSVFSAIKNEVEAHVERHQTDPDWMVSRLQMHWKTRYSKTYVNGSHWSHGDGQAKVPTVRFAGERDWNSPYMTPSLAELQPFSDDERGIWARNGKKAGKPWEWAPYSETGHMVVRINANIIGLAEKAAFLYWFTDDDKYAKFAADIIWTYIEGMDQRSNPITFKDHSKASIIGLATFEVIHEGVCISLAVAYDYLYDYLLQEGRDVGVAENLFRRWSDRIIEGGGAEGNWNINQARNFVYMGLALEENAHYADGKGRGYYLAAFTSVSSAHQKGLQDVVPQAYDPVDGVWPEAPGYAFSVTDTILKLSEVIHNASGQDVLEMYPIIVPAATVASQFVFPHGYMVGFGDTYHQVPYLDSLELLLARFERQGNEAAARQIVPLIENQMKLNGYRRDRNRSLQALTSYVDRLPEGDAQQALQTRIFYADSVNLLIQRNSTDAENGLMVSLAGSRGGHMNANGMAMELYGKGMILGPDSGRGPSYWTKSHGEYYARFAAHNTVSVDGISNYHTSKAKKAFKLLSAEPKPGAHEALSEAFSFSDAEFIEPKTDALQRRVLGIVRTSETAGYYIDIFRSKRRDGQDGKHEYIYHNVGQSMAWHGLDGATIEMQPTEELGKKCGDHVGYNYFTEKFSAPYSHDFSAQFHVSLKRDEDVEMALWMKGEAGRTLFQVKAPVSRAVSKGSVPRELQDLPLQTVLIRQDGEAWKRPFLAVYEPFFAKEGSSLKSITALESEDEAGDFVGLRIESKSRSTEFVLNHTDDRAKVRIADEKIVFIGSYGVIQQDQKGMKAFYLGRGRALIKDSMGIDGLGELVCASLIKTAAGWEYSADKQVRIRVDGTSYILPPAQRALVGE